MPEDEIPFGHWIQKNPIGSAIALSLTFVLLAWMANPSTSPLTNSSMTDSMNTFYSNIQWLGWIFYPLLPFAIVYGYTKLPEPQKIALKLQIAGVRNAGRLRPVETVSDQPAPEEEEGGGEE